MFLKILPTTHKRKAKLNKNKFDFCVVPSTHAVISTVEIASRIGMAKKNKQKTQSSRNEQSLSLKEWSRTCDRHRVPFQNQKSRRLFL